MNQKLHDQLLEDPPRFHFWNNQEQVGGMGPKQLRLIEQGIEELSVNAPRVFIETGAGVSTVWALNLGMEVHSFVAERRVADRIAAFLETYPHLAGRWRPVVGYSESTLPLNVLGEDGVKAGVCLIDGGHGIQTVFVDFVYLNYALARDGLMFVDDLQLGSSSLLSDLLKQERGYQALSRADKLEVFKKVSDARFLGDWEGQRGLLEQIRMALHPVDDGGRRS